MRPKISSRNIKYYLAQRYAYPSIDNFFESSVGFDAHREKVVTEIVEVFTGYTLEHGRLACYNPYTSKNETLKIKNFNHIQSREELLKELSMLHKAKRQILTQSRKRLLELSKKKTQKRDHDLTATMQNTESKRLQALKHHKDLEDKAPEQER